MIKITDENEFLWNMIALILAPLIGAYHFIEG